MSREGYKMTELGEMPQEWEIKQLGHIARGKGEYGIGASATEYTDGNPRYLRITDIGDDGKLLSNDIRGLAEINYEEYLLRENDIVFARTGNTTGKTYLYEQRHGELVYAGFLIRFKINDSLMDSRFVKYFTQTRRYWNWVKVMSTRSGQPGINSNEYSTLKIPVPPIVEQNKISDILSTVDQQIEQTDALIEKTKELKKGLMQRLLTKGIGHTEFRDTEIGRIPKGWEVKRLGEVSNINPESLSSKTDPNFVLKYIDIESVTTGKINGTKEFCFAEAPSRARRIVVYNDVIISTVRPYLKAFAIVKTDEDNMICSTGFAVIRAINNNNPDFLFQYTLSDCFINQLSNKMVGSNYPAVNASDVKESLIAVPPINEQKRIAQVLSEFDIQINELEDKKEKLCILKSGLMDKLLTGRVRVKI